MIVGEDISSGERKMGAKGGVDGGLDYALRRRNFNFSSFWEKGAGRNRRGLSRGKKGTQRGILLCRVRSVLGSGSRGVDQ
jgi:hypothetical protein